MTSKARKRIGVFLLCAAIVALDQWTKQLARTFLFAQPPRIYLGDLFRLQYSENPGAFMSLGAGMSTDTRVWVLTIAVGFLLLALAWVLVRRKFSGLSTFALALLLSGGVGNWIDRAFRPAHTVVDFMNMGVGGLRTGIFNVADLAITTGVVILLLGSLSGDQSKF